MLAELDRVHASQLDDGVRVLLSRLLGVLDAATGWAVLACRDERAAVGWSVRFSIYCGDRTGRKEIVKRWLTERDMAASPSIALSLRDTGRFRAFRPRVEMGAEAWQACEVRSDLAALGMHDRVIGACPVRDDVEVYLGFDRAVSQPLFEAHDEATLRATVEAVQRTCRWLALSFGVLPQRATLSPREREVLGRLLTGASEKAIAAELDLTDGSVHQVVVRLFRKLGVSSRPELMALWLDTASDHGLDLPEIETHS